jgi:hypothetical protein
MIYLFVSFDKLTPDVLWFFIQNISKGSKEFPGKF